MTFLRKFLFLAHSDKFWMNSKDQLRDLLHDIETYLGPFPELYPNGDISEVRIILIINLKNYML